jgi:hypothetical protein
MRALIVVALALALAGCARSEAVRTSSNTMFISTSAAPVCGGQGALHVAQEQAAIQTIRAGYDRYFITGGQAQNNVAVTQMPGSYETTGTYTGTYGGGFYQSNTTYQPGPTIIHGSHDQGITIVMFHEGEPNAQQAIPARETLGPDWEEKVKRPHFTCL